MLHYLKRNEHDGQVTLSSRVKFFHRFYWWKTLILAVVALIGLTIYDPNFLGDHLVASILIVFGIQVLQPLMPQKNYSIHYHLREHTIEGHPVAEDATIVLDRQLNHSPPSLAADSSYTTYFSRWLIKLSQNDQEYDLLTYEYDGHMANEQNFYNQPWIEQMAQQLASDLKLPLVSHPDQGLLEHQHSTSYISRLQDQQVDSYQSSYPTPKGFEIKRTSEGYDIINTNYAFSPLAVILFLLTAFMVFELLVQSFSLALSLLAFVLLLLPLVFMIHIRTMEVVSLSKDKIEAKIVSDLHYFTLPLETTVSFRPQDLDDVILGHYFDSYSLELVADEGHIGLEGDLPLKDAEQLKLLLDGMLVQLA